jgi:hypothetical protein
MDIISLASASKANSRVGVLEMAMPLKADITGHTGAITIPRGTTAERPSLGVGDSTLRYNTDEGGLENWDGNSWANVSAAISVVNLKGTDTVANITTVLTGMVAEDLWIASDTLDGYVYDGTTWINIGPLQGPQGVQGTQGPAGSGIDTVVRTTGDGSLGTTDTYTITMDDTSTSTFDVANGETVNSITKTAGTGAPGTTDTYTVWKDAGETIVAGTFDVYNGINGEGIIASIVAGTNITVDVTDPANPIINADAAALTDITGVLLTGEAI